MGKGARHFEANYLRGIVQDLVELVVVLPYPFPPR